MPQENIMGQCSERQNTPTTSESCSCLNPNKLLFMKTTSPPVHLVAVLELSIISHDLHQQMEIAQLSLNWRSSLNSCWANMNEKFSERSGKKKEKFEYFHDKRSNPIWLRLCDTATEDNDDPEGDSRTSALCSLMLDVESDQNVELRCSQQVRYSSIIIKRLISLMDYTKCLPAHAKKRAQYLNLCHPNPPCVSSSPSNTSSF